MKWIACLSPLLFLIGASDARASSLTAQEIMQRVADRDEGDDAVRDIEMTLIDRNGSRRERAVRILTKSFEEETRQILFFLSPPDVADVGLLTFDHEGSDRDDDQWLYLPALRKTKRIASGDQSGQFLGTDFTFADMTQPETDRYEYALLGKEDVRGEPAWKIRALPNPREVERTGYTRSVLWVLENSFVIVRAVHWLREDRGMKYYDVSRLDQVDGIWSPIELSMTTKTMDQTTDHRTLLRVSNLRYGSGHETSLFTVRQLERGP